MALGYIKSRVKRAAKGVKSGVKRIREEGGGAAKELTGVSLLESVLSPDINIPAPPEERVMPIPDVELGISARRKQRARRRGGRSASILTGQDTLG